MAGAARRRLACSPVSTGSRRRRGGAPGRSAWRRCARREPRRACAPTAGTGRTRRRPAHPSRRSRRRTERRTGPGSAGERPEDCDLRGRPGWRTATSGRRGPCRRRRAPPRRARRRRPSGPTRMRRRRAPPRWRSRRGPGVPRRSVGGGASHAGASATEPPTRGSRRRGSPRRESPRRPSRPRRGSARRRWSPARRGRQRRALPSRGSPLGRLPGGGLGDRSFPGGHLGDGRLPDGDLGGDGLGGRDVPGGRLATAGASQAGARRRRLDLSRVPRGGWLPDGGLSCAGSPRSGGLVGGDERGAGGVLGLAVGLLRLPRVVVVRELRDDHRLDGRGVRTARHPRRTHGGGLGGQLGALLVLGHHARHDEVLAGVGRRGLGASAEAGEQTGTSGGRGRRGGGRCGSGLLRLGPGRRRGAAAAREATLERGDRRGLQSEPAVEISAEIWPSGASGRTRLSSSNVFFDRVGSPVDWPAR